MRNRKLKSTLLLVPLLLLMACATRSTTPGVPATPVTPMEQFAVTNASLATVNHAIAQGAIQLNTSGALDDATTQTVLTWTFKAADADKQITLIVQSSDSSVTKGAKIRVVIEQLRVSASGLIASSTLNIKNPASKQTIQADVQAILSLAETLVTELQAGGVIP